MKIELTIEIHPRTNFRGETHDPDSRLVLNWLEKNHYMWDAARAIVDGDVVFDWAQGRATPNQLKEIRRQVVEEALGIPVLQWRQHSYDRNKEMLATDYQEVMDEYAADPNAPWVKKIRSTIKAAANREAKKTQVAKQLTEAHEAEKQTKHEFGREIAKDEDIRQQVLESQGQPRVSRKRILELVNARVLGTGNFDPTPQTPEEEAAWARICRSCEAQVNLKLPGRFHGFIHDGKRQVSVSFDF